MAAVFCLLVMTGVDAFSAFTDSFDSSRKCSLTIYLADDPSNAASAEGAVVTLYRVADYAWNGGSPEYSFSGGFEEMTAAPDPESGEQAEALVLYAEENGISGTSVTSGRDAKAVFTGLSPGIYLAAEKCSPQYTEAFRPFMISLPLYEGGVWNYDAEADPKLFPVTQDDDELLTEVSVQKVWKDNGQEHPASVTVSLVNSKGVFDTVTLNAENSWSHTWKALDGTEKWSVRETDIPAGYSVSYKQEDNVFTVINTHTPPPGDTLIQTGQLNWPVPVLAVSGLLLMAGGLVLRSSGKKNRNGK